MIKECDCGFPCDDGRNGCDRCRYLDGRNTGEAQVIAALRLIGKAAPCELVELTGLKARSVGQILRRLKQKKRVQFLGFEVHVHEKPTRFAGPTNQSVRYYYELTS